MEQNDTSDVLDLWNNLPAVARGVSVAGIVLYIFTVLLAVGYSAFFPWYVVAGLILWPAVVVIWIMVIWLAVLIFSVTTVLAGRNPVREDPGRTARKIIVFIPTVIGASITVVEAFFNDVFQPSAAVVEKDNE